MPFLGIINVCVWDEHYMMLLDVLAEKLSLLSVTQKFYV